MRKKFSAVLESDRAGIIVRCGLWVKHIYTLEFLELGLSVIYRFPQFFFDFDVFLH